MNVVERGERYMAIVIFPVPRNSVLSALIEFMFISLEKNHILKKISFFFSIIKKSIQILAFKKHLFNAFTIPLSFSSYDTTDLEPAISLFSFLFMNHLYKL